jgi:outer membrane receptor for Fe3+-dicitrate
MKKILAIASICWLTFSSVQAQVVSIPDKSEKHFAQKYAGAQNADWTNNVVNYTCKFKYKGQDMRAYYHMDGTWDFTAAYMNESDLPAAVRESVSKSRMSDWQAKSAARIENHKGKTLYRVERKKGIEESYIFYDAKGKEVKSTLKL